MMSEYSMIHLALPLYSVAALMAFVSAYRREVSDRAVLWVLTMALAFHTASIALRWSEVGHGPYVNLYEVLTSNTWSLHVAVLAACLLVPTVRVSLAPVLALLQVLVIWLWIEPPISSEIPVTYFTIWLSVHVWVGKVFLGCLTVAAGLALTVLAYRFGWLPKKVSMVSDVVLDELAYRFVGVAFLFETLMLVAGAIWAQDAWGRYWDWDPLETWSFSTWVLAAAYLHLRGSRRLGARVSAVAIIALFVVAFFTFFGMPFISIAAHKGAI